MLNQADAKWLLAFARETIAAKAAGRALPELPSSSDVAARFFEPGGVFVTLKKRKMLRGCIGLMESDLPLVESIQHMAVAASTEDPRFPAVQRDELDLVRIEISVLSPMRRLRDHTEVRLGTDGVLVRRGGRSGVFLPQVAEDTGWDLDRFLSELCANKAGLEPDAWKRPETELYGFTVEVLEEGTN